MRSGAVQPKAAPAKPVDAVAAAEVPAAAAAQQQQQKTAAEPKAAVAAGGGSGNSVELKGRFYAGAAGAQGSAWGVEQIARGRETACGTGHATPAGPCFPHAAAHCRRPRDNCAAVRSKPTCPPISRCSPCRPVRVLHRATAHHGLHAEPRRSRAAAGRQAEHVWRKVGGSWGQLAAPMRGNGTDGAPAVCTHLRALSNPFGLVAPPFFPRSVQGVYRELSPNQRIVMDWRFRSAGAAAAAAAAAGWLLPLPQ